MVRGGKGAWIAALVATATVACAAHAPPVPPIGDPPLTATPPATPAPGPADPGDAGPTGPLEAPEAADRIELSALLFAREDRPTLLEERLLISGIDPRDVRDFLQAYNRRSDLVQFTPDGVAFAPHVLERILALQPGQVLQFRYSGQGGKLVFRLVFP
jgi:hypothetical protein